MSEPALPNPVPAAPAQAPAPGITQNSALNQTLPVSLTAVPGTGTTAQYFTAEDLAKVRQQEKDKLYASLEEMKKQVSTLQEERDIRAASEEAARKKADQEAAEKAKAEMTLKERVAAMEREQEERFAKLQAERDNERALYEKEREFMALQDYRQRRLNEERDQILPELLDLISGNTQDEIEKSIAGLRDRTERILEGARQGLSQIPPSPGARVTAPPAGPLDTHSDNQQLTPEDIRNMDISEYAKSRERLLGSAAGGRSRGLFG